MTGAVSVVIPTTGRASLRRAVASALRQTRPATELLVVADRPHLPPLPDDPRIRVLHTAGGVGASRARQFGIDRAAGTVIALLDDDDEWRPDKLARQLETVDGAGAEWIVSCAVAAVGPAGTAVWPRRPIAHDEPVDAFLFRFHSPRFGGATLQTSTLCFPRAVARHARWDDEAGAVHDDIRWLLDVRAALPGVAIVQLPDPLVTYHLTAESVSRTRVDRTDDYLAWGRTHLASADRRTRGDYFLTSPVAAAVGAGSAAGVLRSVGAGLRHGRPGVAAASYAAAALPRAIRRRCRR